MRRRDLGTLDKIIGRTETLQRATKDAPYAFRDKLAIAKTALMDAMREAESHVRSPR